MTGKDFSRTLSRLTELGVKAVVLTGGEPLEHPTLFELLRLSEPFPLALSMITSGRVNRSLSTLKRARPWLDGLTISADSLGTQHIGKVERTPEWAFRLARALAPLRCIVHIVVHRLSSSELETWARELKDAPYISVEVSALQLDEGGRIRNGLSQAQCAEIIEADSLLVAEVLGASPQFFTKRDLLVQRLMNVASDSCRSSRLFVSASGELRRCPYDKDAGASIYDSRDQIRALLRQKWSGVERATDPRCVGVCH